MRILFISLALNVGCGSTEDTSHAHGSAKDANPEVSDDSRSDVVEDSDPARVGDPCSVADACPNGGSGTTVCLTTSPGGYCAVKDCAQHGHDCPNDPGLGGTPGANSSQCVTLAIGSYCMRNCSAPADCRTGYTCASRPDASGHAAVSVCVPTS